MKLTNIMDLTAVCKAVRAWPDWKKAGAKSIFNTDLDNTIDRALDAQDRLDRCTANNEEFLTNTLHGVKMEPKSGDSRIIYNRGGWKQYEVEVFQDEFTAFVQGPGIGSLGWRRVGPLFDTEKHARDFIEQRRLFEVQWQKTMDLPGEVVAVIPS